MAAEIEDNIVPGEESTTVKDSEQLQKKDIAEESVKQKEPAAKKEEKSGIRRRIKINVPGIINTDKSSNKPPCELIVCICTCINWLQKINGRNPG